MNLRTSVWKLQSSFLMADFDEWLDSFRGEVGSSYSIIKERLDNSLSNLEWQWFPSLRKRIHRKGTLYIQIEVRKFKTNFAANFRSSPVNFATSEQTSETVREKFSESDCKIIFFFEELETRIFFFFWKSILSQVKNKATLKYM